MKHDTARSVRFGEQGFTLLEVMISLSIVAIALTILLQTSIRAIDLNNESRILTQATILANHEMASIEAAGFPETGATEMEEDKAFSGLFWQSAIHDTPFEGTRRITVTVYSDPEGEKDIVDLIYYVLE